MENQWILGTINNPYVPIAKQAKNTRKTETVFLERLHYVMTSQSGSMHKAGSTMIAVIISQNGITLNGTGSAAHLLLIMVHTGVVTI